MKQCGFTNEELMAHFGNLKSLDAADQIELARILDLNNQSIKNYIDDKTSPKNVTNDVASQLMKDLRKKGMR